MANDTQFDSTRNTAAQSGDSERCSQCEAMLADSLDGTLSPADQAIFDDHMAHCGPCAEMLAHARRGAAWLEMLREPRPKPPVYLLERILIQTSNAQTSNAQIGNAQASSPAGIGTAAHAGIQTFPASPIRIHSNVLPFRSRLALAVRGSGLSQILLQPRLAMTAAMAFFSIALTLDLTGIRLRDLRASDLRPASIQRGFYSTNARVVQYYESLRVVYELESRVHDLQSASDFDLPALRPAAPPATQPADHLGNGSPAPQQTPAPQPSRGPRPRNARPVPNAGTSRREALPASTLRLANLSSSHRIDTPMQGGHA